MIACETCGLREGCVCGTAADGLDERVAKLERVLLVLRRLIRTRLHREEDRMVVWGMVQIDGVMYEVPAAVARAIEDLREKIRKLETRRATEGHGE